MDFFDILRNAWFVLIGVLFAGYSILDGFDLGVGMLTPFIAKDDGKKSILINSIWPVWDGNEVWLLTGAGALFAAFPMAYATVFSGFYLMFMLILFALIFRAVSLEFWYHDISRRKIWAGAFTIGSFLPPLLLGIILGNIILGVPLNAAFQFFGDLTTIFRPFAVVIGIFALVLMIVHGAVYIILKTEGELQEKARIVAGRLWIFLLIIFFISAISMFLFATGSISNKLVWTSCVLSFILLMVLRYSIGNNKDSLSFILSSLIFLTSWLCVGALLYPNLLKGINNQNLTIYNASSSQLTLTIMLIIALIGMPVVIGYTIFVYRVFKGKAKEKLHN